MKCHFILTINGCNYSVFATLIEMENTVTCLESIGMEASYEDAVCDTDIQEEEVKTELDILTERGYATLSELTEAGYKTKTDKGRNEFGFREFEILDNNGNIWDYIPEDTIYELKK